MARLSSRATLAIGVFVGLIAISVGAVYFLFVSGTSESLASARRACQHIAIGLKEASAPHASDAQREDRARKELWLALGDVSSANAANPTFEYNALVMLLQQAQTIPVHYVARDLQLNCAQINSSTPVQ